MRIVLINKISITNRQLFLAGSIAIIIFRQYLTVSLILSILPFFVFRYVGLEIIQHNMNNVLLASKEDHLYR